ncbi:MAG: peptidase, partial [Proteobacteria bacterium]|nr:peptidase [Pseudomonadota bacterium]
MTNRSPRNWLPVLGLAVATVLSAAAEVHAQPASPREAAARKAQAQAQAPRVATGRQAATRPAQRVRTTTPASGRAVAKPAPVVAARATPVSMRYRPDTARSAEAPGDLVLRSTAVLVASQATGQVLFSRNDEKVRSIASITKLMTAMVVLDYNQSMDEPVTITEEDIDATRRLGSRLAAGTTLSRA